MDKKRNFIGIIPARWASSRFPGKPLADILGKPMFAHVHARASACALLDRVVLATDDERIMEAAAEWEVPAVMTSPDHASGTDRVLEAARMVGAGPDTVVVNVQGDEPALDPGMIAELLAPFTRPEVEAATLARPLADAQASDPDRVKVVFAPDGRALYFSRSPIPFDRSGGGGVCFLHIGLYAFAMDVLERFAALPPGRLERIEKLEQLRLLEAGIPIYVSLTGHECIGVDRPEDIATVAKILMEQA